MSGTTYGTSVTHDPLCTWRQAEEADAGDPRRWLAGGLAVCDCALIAKVREDMLTKCIAAVAELPGHLRMGVLFIDRTFALSAMQALQEKP